MDIMNILVTSSLTFSDSEVIQLLHFIYILCTMVCHKHTLVQLSKADTQLVVTWHQCIGKKSVLIYKFGINEGFNVCFLSPAVEYQHRAVELKSQTVYSELLKQTTH